MRRSIASNIDATFSFAGATAKGGASITVSSAVLTSLAITPASAEVAPDLNRGRVTSSPFFWYFD